MVLYVGRGDSTASMRLLWRTDATPPLGRGPRPALSVDEIVRAAIGVADAGGLDALSMRAVGERLGRTSMALYTYVPGKAELVDLMWDQVLADLPDSYDLSDGWRVAVQRWAHDGFAFFQRHPWTLDISGARPGLGPNETRAAEIGASLLMGTALPARDLMRVVGSLSRYVHGAARALAETRRATAETGIGEDEWWLARSGLLEELAPDYGTRFPTLTALALDGAFEPVSQTEPYLEAAARDTFEFGLDRMLDGVAAFIERSASTRPDGEDT